VGPSGACRIPSGDRRPVGLGLRRAHFLRLRCAATGSGSARKGSGVKVATRFGGELYSTPSSRLRRFPGPRTLYLRACSSPRGRAGAPRPRRGVRRVWTVLSPCLTAPRGQGGDRPTKRRSGSAAKRLPTRPVLKHGPRSLTHARVTGPEKPPGAMKVKAGARRAPVGSPRPGAGRPSGPSRALWRGGARAVRRWDPRAPPRGAPPARLARSVGEVEQERARKDPKDGELCLGRAKPEETLVEARSGPDVQIGRPTWVYGRKTSPTLWSLDIS